ncbi:MAG: HD domain-containing protein [Candidatus Zixiibacteriota bacterium]
MKEIFVKDLRPGDTITGFFALRKAELLEKDSRFRLAMELGDSTGRIKAVWWDVSEDQADLYQAGIFVKIKGPVSTYMGANQLRIDQIRPVTKDDAIDMCDFFRAAVRTKDELNALLNAMIERVDNNYLKTLLNNIFGDEDILEKYLTSPAAKLLHHDTIGGLADHSLNIAEIIVNLSGLYPKLNRDLLICGAILHDIGKIWEFSVDSMIEYTDSGRLIGHIAQGDEFVCTKADEIEYFPEDLLMHLRHLIVSHQGELQKGSPVVPQTPEAVLLHHSDELDSRMGAVEKIRERTGDSGWSSYQRIFERFFFFGRGKSTDEAEE